ncbi:MAG: hypothetical protein KGJ07_05885 [Patescibacteria group bacterium]|nr:hypothetical protein [Patescibacteria group bacterium]
MKQNKSKKTKTGIAFLLVVAASLTVQAQTSTPEVNQTGGISAITSGGESSVGASPFAISCYAFGDYAYMGHGDSAGRGVNTEYKGMGAANQIQHPDGIEIRRAYLQGDYNINLRFSGTVLLAYEGNYDGLTKRSMFLKYAFVKWKQIFKGTDLKIVLQPTNSFATAYNTEPLYQYRSVEKTLLDIHGIDASYDMGIMLEGKIATFKGSDSTKFPTFIGYSIMLAENSGSPVPGFAPTNLALNASTDADHKYRGNIFVNTLGGALTVGIYADYINYGNVPYKKSSNGFQDASQLTKVYAAYNRKFFGMGVEGFMQTNKNGEIETWKVGTGTNDTTDATQFGYSIWANANIITNKLKVFARYDSYNPDTKFNYNSNETFSSRIFGAAPSSSNPSGSFSSYGYTETFVNVGLDWMPTKDKKVHVMPNVWYDKITNDYGSDALKTDYYMVYRITFLYAFK